MTRSRTFSSTTRIGTLVGILLLALGALPLRSNASVITDGGINTGFGCTNGFQCGNGSETFSYDTASASGPGFDPAFGTIDLDAGNLLLDLDFDIASSTFVAVGAPDNGVDEIVFTNLNYSATGLGLIDLGGVFSVAGSITISGTYEQLLGGGTVVAATAFSETANVSAGQCTQPGAQLTCSFDFGPGGPFALDVGTTPSSRRFIHTVNAISSPEPGTLALFGSGLIGFAMARRRRA